MSFVASSVALASAIGGAIIGNQQKQKAKGQAAAVQRDSQAAQAAADAKAKQLHDQNIQDQSQVAEIARRKLDPNDPLANATPVNAGSGSAAPTPNAPAGGGGLDPVTARRLQTMGTRAQFPTLLTPSRGRTTLLGS